MIENLELFSKHLEVELDLEDQLPRYADDLHPLIANAFMAGEEREKSNAAVAIRTIRRERFEFADEFIQEWRKWILKIRTLRMDIDTHCNQIDAPRSTKRNANDCQSTRWKIKLALAARLLMTISSEFATR